MIFKLLGAALIIVVVFIAFSASFVEMH